VFARSHFFERGAVPVSVAENLEAFEEITGVAATLKFFRREEIVVDAVDFAGPGRARGGGDAQA
jgi:hypothetical protein